MVFIFASALSFLVLLITVHAQIRIVSPETLSREFDANHGVVYGTTATFGAPYYGERVLGELVYGEPKLGLAHCTADDYDLPPSMQQQEMPPYSMGENVKHGSYAKHGLVNVVLVHRGQCTFVTKAKVAQAKNAHAMIVVDHHPSTIEEIQKTIMADDGYGYEVKIPSVMVSSQDGLKLERAIKQFRVVVELVWNIPRGKVVIVDFWMSSASEETSSFLTRFQESAEVLKCRLQFRPHYHVFTLPAEVGKNAQLCIEGKQQRYCAPDPDGDGPVTGADVAMEDLRQLCLWRTTATTVPGVDPPVVYSEAFWDYVAQLSQACPVNGRTPEHRFGTVCADKILEGSGIEVKTLVQKCTQQNLDEYLMDEVVNVAWSPQALRVNGWRYSGPLDPETVLKAVCHGFLEMPPECVELLSAYGPMTYLISFRSFVLSLLLVIGVPVCACRVYKHVLRISMRTSLRHEIAREVETQMTTYAPLAQDCHEQTHRPTPNF